MPHDDALYLGHMLETARKAAAKAAGVSEARFLEDENLHLALVHLVQTIGEAARHVSPETRARHVTIPWADVIGMRHRVVHDYISLDLGIVWTVVTKNVPALIAQLEQIAPPPSA